MRCLKCGREIPPTDVFCSQCQEEMDRSPVSRETPLVIPERPQRPVVRRRTPPKPEEQVAHLKRQRKFLWITCAVLFVACCLLAVCLVLLLRNPTARYYGRGQNYNSVTTSPTEPSTVPQVTGGTAQP